jgi:hypothetical protein
LERRGSHVICDDEEFDHDHDGGMSKLFEFISATSAEGEIREVGDFGQTLEQFYSHFVLNVWS